MDNGIAGHAGVDRAHELGIRVLVTDHHLPAVDAHGEPTLPDADVMHDDAVPEKATKKRKHDADADADADENKGEDKPPGKLAKSDHVKPSADNSNPSVEDKSKALKPAGKSIIISFNLPKLRYS